MDSVVFRNYVYVNRSSHCGVIKARDSDSVKFRINQFQNSSLSGNHRQNGIPATRHGCTTGPDRFDAYLDGRWPDSGAGAVVSWRIDVARATHWIGSARFPAAWCLSPWFPAWATRATDGVSIPTLQHFLTRIIIASTKRNGTFYVFLLNI